MLGAIRWVIREAGLRFLARRKTACVVAVTTMALALGANTAALSIYDALMTSSFGVPEAGRLRVIAPVRQLPGRGEVIFAEAYPNYERLREVQRAFSEVACFLQNVSSWDDGTETRAIPAARVTASFFATVGVQPAIGRVFEAADEGPSPAPVVIVGFALWQDAMGADPGVLGSTLVLDGEAHTVIGVMPAGFRHPLPTDLWLPFDAPERTRTAVVGGRTFGVYGRLADGVTEGAAAEEADRLTRLAIEASADNAEYQYHFKTVDQLVAPGADRTATLVQLGALLLTLLAVVNLSALLVAWGHERSGEMAVRVALGASGGRVARMLVLQSLAVVGAGGVAGLALAAVALPVIRQLDVAPTLALYLTRARLEPSIFAWSLLATALAGLAAGLLPALLGRASTLGGRLGAGARQGVSGAALRWQRGMVLGQALLAVLVLTTAALVAVTYRNLKRVPDGFVAEGATVARIQLSSGRFADSHEARAAFGERLMDAIEAEPELSAAGFTSTLPVGDVPWGGRFYVELPDGSVAEEPLLFHFRRISGSYLNATGIPLLRGRTFDERDRIDGPAVAIVSRSLAERLWPGEDAVGKGLHRFLPDAPPMRLEVVGVVGDAMDGGYSAPPGEAVYVPWSQVSVTRMSVVARGRGAPERAVAAIRSALRAADPTVAAGDVAELPTLVRQANALPMIQSLLLGAFGLVAVGIVALGAYGLMSQLVAVREREYAVRLAMGAPVARIGSSVVADAARTTAWGVFLGMVGTVFLAGFLRPFLFGVDPRSAPVIAAVGLAVLGLGAAAALPAALRAMRVRVAASLARS